MNSKTPISDEQLKKLEYAIKEQYNDRIKEKGTTPEGLFWDSEQSMETRFDIAADTVNFEGKSLLDVGCGFGDLYGYLKQRGDSPETYYGIDISEGVIAEARNRYGDESGVSFENRNILRDPYESEQFDIAAIFGAMWNNVESINNEAYMRRFMRTCFICADVVIVNALSCYRQGDWSYEESVYYYDPAKVFSYAQELTRNVQIRHDFQPIPQKEFLLVLEDDGEGSSEVAIADPGS